MNPTDFPLHFLRPWWWLALLPLPWVVWTLARRSGGRAALARLADSALLPHLLHAAHGRRWLVPAWVAFAWLLGVAAMAGPAWQQVPTPMYVNGAARVVALSLSNDMLARDLKPDRMTRARFAVRDLLDAAGDARTALVAYAGAAFTVAPLTDDTRTVLNLLRALKPEVMPVAGNDAAAGIRQSVKLLHGAHVRGGEIILVTDTADAAAVAAARKAHARGIRVDVLGIGTAQGAPVPTEDGDLGRATGDMRMARRDDAALRAVANAGDGSYAVLPAGGGPTPAFAAPVAVAGHASRTNHARIWRDGGIWLLPALVVLAAVAFRRGWLLVLLVLVMPIAVPTAHAATWPSWWTNRNQRARQALQHGNPQQARNLATTPGIRGAADYRAGDYADAAEAFAQGHGARAHYNLGNALAKTGEYRKAIAAYDQALKLDPELTDARANRAAVRKWLARHAQRARSGSSGGRRTSKPGATRRGHNSSRRGAGSTARPGRSMASPSRGAGGGSRPARGAGSRQHPTGKSESANGIGRQVRAPNGTSGARSSTRSARMQQALQRELARHHDHSVSSAPAFALGQDESKLGGRLNAQQRALLRSVPDDPGALLRRKFRLEWQQRNGHGQGGGS